MKKLEQTHKLNIKIVVELESTSPNGIINLRSDVREKTVKTIMIPEDMTENFFDTDGFIGTVFKTAVDRYETNEIAAYYDELENE